MGRLVYPARYETTPVVLFDEPFGTPVLIDRRTVRKRS